MSVYPPIFRSPVLFLLPSMTVSKVTVCPSFRLVRPAAYTAVMWTNMSVPPSCGSMKPKPLSALTHFTVSVGIRVSFAGDGEGRWQTYFSTKDHHGDKATSTRGRFFRDSQRCELLPWMLPRLCQRSAKEAKIPPDRLIPLVRPAGLEPATERL